MLEYGHKLADDAIVVVKARLDAREDEPKLVVIELDLPQLVVEGGQPLRISLPAEQVDAAGVARLKELLVAHPGPCPVLLQIGTKVLRLPPGFNVDTGNGLCAELRLVPGLQLEL
jgi:DNA polymerase-3 subunit alpha